MVAPVIARVARESVLKHRKYSSLTNREISRVKENITDRARGIIEDPTADSWGAKNFFKMIEKYEKIVTDAGMSEKQLGANLRKLDPIIHKAYVNELKKFDSYDSLTRKSARNQAKYARDFLTPEVHDQMNDEEKTAFWNTVKYYSNNEYGKVISSDQVLEIMNNQMNNMQDPHDFFNPDNLITIDSGPMAGNQIYGITELDSVVERNDENLESLAVEYRDTVRRMEPKKKSARQRRARRL